MAVEAGLGYPIILARSYTPGRKMGQPSVIFIHTTEGSEGPSSAENGAKYDQVRTDGTSAHLYCDSNSTVQGVPTYHEAHTARSRGNDVGVHIEVCGKAGQSDAQWHDAVSIATVNQVALACVKLRAKYPGRFPLVNLTPAQLRAGKYGFAGHDDATKAWPEDGGTHWDPGPYFPWDELFQKIRDIENGVSDMEVWEETFPANDSWTSRFGTAPANYGMAARQSAMQSFDAARAATANGAAIIALANAVSGMDAVDEVVLGDTIAASLRSSLALDITTALLAAGVELTPEAIKEATESAVRNVLGGLDSVATT